MKRQTVSRELNRATSAIVVLVSLAAQASALCPSQDPMDDWTDPPLTGSLSTGGLIADEDYLDPNTGDPANLDPNSGIYGDALDILASANPEYYGEISQAQQDGIYGFVAVLPGDGVAGQHRRGVIRLVLRGKTPIAVCGTIAHEWTHARRRGGAEGNPPTTSDEENSPCGHMNAYCAQLMAWEAIAEHACFDFEVAIIPCGLYDFYHRKCDDLAIACDVGGGIMPCICGTILCDCIL